MCSAPCGLLAFLFLHFALAPSPQTEPFCPRESRISAIRHFLLFTRQLTVTFWMLVVFRNNDEVTAVHRHVLFHRDTKQ